MSKVNGEYLHEHIDKVHVEILLDLAAVFDGSGGSSGSSDIRLLG